MTVAALAGHGRWQLLIAFVAGASLPLAFAPFDLHPVSWLSLSALWLLWENRTPREAARLGFMWGSGAFLAGTYWLYISIHIFGEAPIAVAILLMLSLVAVMALYPALVGWLVTRAPVSGNARWLLLLPGSWVLAEWLRGWVLTGFPWLSLGYSQIDSWLAGYAPLLGVHGVSLVVAMLAACVVALILGTGARRFVPLTVAGAIGLMAFVLDGRTWTAAGDQEIPVALIQGAVPQEKKWLPEQLAPTKALYLEQTRKHWDADIVIWPEAAIPAMIDEEFDFLESVDAEAVANGSAVILGMLERGLDDGRYYNSVMTLGAEHGIYRKRHLVPFGEYFPVPAFVRQWMRLMSLPYVDISAGEPAPPPLVVAGQTIGMTICYEDAYGAEQLVFLPEAAVLVNVSNDAWFGDSIAPHQHLQIARMRALETGRYLLRATNTGISAVIGPGGEIRGRSPQFETHVLTGVVRAYSGATPYVRTGNIVVVLLCALLVFASLVRRSK